MSSLCTVVIIASSNLSFRLGSALVNGEEILYYDFLGRRI